MTMEVRALTTGRVRLKRADRGVRRYFSEDWADATKWQPGPSDA